MKGLSQDAVKLALRVLTDTVAKQLKARQACTVDLGVGQLRFAGNAALAEFTAKPSWQHAPPAQVTAPAAAPAASSKFKQTPCSNESKAAVSSCSGPSQPNSSQKKAAAPAHTPSARMAAAAARAAAAATAAASGCLSAGVPDKHSNCDYDAVDAWEIAREVRTAAAQNARVRPAGFVLPAGGPDDDGGGEPRMPQGKGKVPAQATLGRQQVSATT